MQYPRVIIIGETFRLNEGGGITLTNLFKEWPDDHIGVITDLISHTNTKTKYSYYQLGQEEIKFPFPFSRFQTYFQSGPYTFTQSTVKTEISENKTSGFQQLKKNIRPWFDNILNKTGLHSSFYKINLSESMKKWILDFNPDIIYIQPFQHNMMQFGISLYEALKIPYAMHIMDDSVKYINKSFLFHGIIQRKIENDFSNLVKNARVHLCISEAMADEYYRRYGKKFQDFRNPIEVEHWRADKNFTKTETTDHLKIIYTGRIFPPTVNSFTDICKIVDKLNRNGKKVTLNYTLKCDPQYKERIASFKGVNSLPPVEFKNLPKLIQEHDIFVICINFDKQAKKYLQFSMSTRASEGMISGVPVLIYAPSDLALSLYFSKAEGGCVVGERDLSTLENSILKLWNDRDYRNKLSNNAIKTASNESDTLIVREAFRKALNITE